jgi:hypothetical protein
MNETGPLTTHHTRNNRLAHGALARAEAAQTALRDTLARSVEARLVAQETRHRARKLAAAVHEAKARLAHRAHHPGGPTAKHGAN